MDEIEKELVKAYHTIHDNLMWMPVEYCCWKVDNRNGKITTKTKQEYWNYYSFLFDQDLRNNLSQLRFCLDYYWSLYKLHKPGLLFGWHHKLIMCQILGAIYEGLLFDLLEIKNLTDNKTRLLQLIVKENIDSNKFGLGRLLNLYQGASLLKTEERDWFQYITYLKNLRDTVHPKSLNAESVHFQNNPLLAKNPEELIVDLEKFVNYFKNLY